MAQCQNKECGHQFVDEFKKALGPDGWKDPLTAYYICPDCHKRSFFSTSTEYDSSDFNQGELEK